MTSRSNVAETFEEQLAAMIEAAQWWIEFEEKRHRYHIVLPDKTRIQAPSVTTVIEGVLSIPALPGWAARVQREADMNLLRLAAFHGQSAAAALAAIECTKADAHRRIKETAGDLGTEVHGLIERWCARLAGVRVADVEVSDDALYVFTGWERWAKDVKLMPIALEKRLAHRTLRYAGKLDFFGYAEGRLAVIDWKSSKGIYDSHILQGVAYVKALADMGLPECEAMVCRLPKEAGDEIEPRWIEGDYNEHFAAFTSLLKVYQWRKNAA